MNSIFLHTLNSRLVISSALPLGVMGVGIYEFIGQSSDSIGDEYYIVMPIKLYSILLVSIGCLLLDLGLIGYISDSQAQSGKRSGP